MRDDFRRLRVAKSHPLVGRGRRRALTPAASRSPTN